VCVSGGVRPLHPIVCGELSQIGREALSNAFRHSHASQIEVELHYEPNQLRLRIRDEGHGIEPRVLEQGYRSGHWGLPDMRETRYAENAVFRPAIGRCASSYLMACTLLFPSGYEKLVQGIC